MPGGTANPDSKDKDLPLLPLRPGLTLPKAISHLKVSPCSQLALLRDRIDATNRHQKGSRVMQERVKNSVWK